MGMGELLRRAVWHPMGWVEKRAFEPAAAALKRWAFLDILEHAGKAVVLVAVVLFFWKAPTRERDAKYAAWQVISTAQGNTMRGVRATHRADARLDEPVANSPARAQTESPVARKVWCDRAL